MVKYVTEKYNFSHLIQSYTRRLFSILEKDASACKFRMHMMWIHVYIIYNYICIRHQYEGVRVQMQTTVTDQM